MNTRTHTHTHEHTHTHTNTHTHTRIHRLLHMNEYSYPSTHRYTHARTHHFASLINYRGNMNNTNNTDITILKHIYIYIYDSYRMYIVHLEMHIKDDMQIGWIVN